MSNFRITLNKYNSVKNGRIWKICFLFSSLKPLFWKSFVRFRIYPPRSRHLLKSKDVLQFLCNTSLLLRRLCNTSFPSKDVLQLQFFFAELWHIKIIYTFCSFIASTSITRCAPRGGCWSDLAHRVCVWTIIFLKKVIT